MYAQVLTTRYLDLVDKAGSREQRAHTPLHVGVVILGQVVGVRHARIGQVGRRLGFKLELGRRPLFGACAGLLPRLLHRALVACHVDRQAGLLGHELREVDGEAKCVPQQKGVGAAEGRVVRGGCHLFKLLDALGHGAAERALLVVQDLHNLWGGWWWWWRATWQAHLVTGRAELWVEAAKVVEDAVHETGEKAVSAACRYILPQTMCFMCVVEYDDDAPSFSLP